MEDTNNAVNVEIRSSNGFLYQLFTASIASQAALLMGCSLGWSSPVIVLLSKSKDGFVLSKSEEGWLASILFFGAIAGGPCAGYLIDKSGRKLALGVNAVLYALSLGVIVSAQYKWMLFAGRFLNGVSCGFTSISAPTYISEISSASNRGKLGIMFQIMVTIGILLINVIGLIESWRWITVSIIIMDSIWLFFLYFIPESPVYHLINNNEPLARSVLQRLRGDEDIEEEVNVLKNVVASLNEKAAFSDLLKSCNLKPLLISILVMMGQQASGINAVLSYSESIFKSAHTNLKPLAETIIMDLVMVIATFFAAIVSDKLGRRVLLQISGSSIILTLFTIGTYYFLDSHNYAIAKTIRWLPLLCLSLHVISFSMGYGPIPWLLMSEIFAPEVKGFASAIASGSNWGMGFLVTLTFPILSDLVGQYMVFFIYGSIMIILLILSIAFVPETKGKTLDEIHRLFKPNEVPQNDEEGVEEEREELNEDDVSESDLLLNT
ncbi:facilitated trehalose transporter Tret1 isoform X1 [Lepeophtheirus salmonis]|uniref:facilitated trehalose transporter Tret1 isoform X1 n=1 Tax=Lepeophtheirus salmonis TaxID=72036 RepID=UPI001AE94B83|nr:facilitated trehalose transporter Tret1-like isoform X1 [Lepeophtheirus salmonis]